QMRFPTIILRAMSTMVKTSMASSEQDITNCKRTYLNDITNTDRMYKTKNKIFYKHLPTKQILYNEVTHPRQQNISPIDLEFEIVLTLKLNRNLIEKRGIPLLIEFFDKFRIHHHSLNRIFGVDGGEIVAATQCIHYIFSLPLNKPRT